LAKDISIVLKNLNDELTKLDLVESRKPTFPVKHTLTPQEMQREMMKVFEESDQEKKGQALNPSRKKNGQPPAGSTTKSWEDGNLPETKSPPLRIEKRWCVGASIKPEDLASSTFGQGRSSPAQPVKIQTDRQKERSVEKTLKLVSSSAVGIVSPVKDKYEKKGLYSLIGKV
jgi:hypothetical protein